MGKRMKVLGKRRSMVIVTMAVLLLSVAVVIGSGANFTSQSTNPGNTFSAAGFRIWNEHEGTAVFNVTGMAPGDSTSQTWWVELDSTVAADITVSLANIVAPVGAYGGNLADRLNVVITDVDTSTEVYNAPLVAGTHTIGNWAAGTHHDFSVAVEWVDGTPAEDNPASGSSCQFDIVWDATQS